MNEMLRFALVVQLGVLGCGHNARPVELVPSVPPERTPTATPAIEASAPIASPAVDGGDSTAEVTASDASLGLSPNEVPPCAADVDESRTPLGEAFFPPRAGWSQRLFRAVGREFLACVHDHAECTVPEYRLTYQVEPDGSITHLVIKPRWNPDERASSRAAALECMERVVTAHKYSPAPGTRGCVLDAYICSLHAINGCNIDLDYGP